MQLILIILIIVILLSAITVFSEIFRYPSLIKLIQKSINEGNIDEARLLAKKIPLRKRKDPYSLWVNAKINSESGQYILAMSALQDILYKGVYTHGLKESEVRAALVDIYQKTGRRKEAFELLERMKFQKRDDLFANSNLGKYYFKEQRYDEAETHFNIAIDSGSMDSEVYYMFASILYMKGEVTKSLKYLKMALKLKENYVDAIMLEGIIEYESGNYKKAETIFSTLKSVSEYNTTVLSYIALCRFSLGDLNESLKVAEYVLPKINGKLLIYGTLLWSMAEAYISKGKLLELEYILKKLIDFDPNNEYARAKLKMYKYIFEYPNILMPFINSTELEFKEICKNMLESFDYIIDETTQTLNQINIICHPKKTRHDTVLVIFSRLDRILEVKDLDNFAKMGSDEHVSLVYVFTPFIFSVECIGFKSDRLILECYNGKDLVKVFSHEDII